MHYCAQYLQLIYGGEGGNVLSDLNMIECGKILTDSASGREDRLDVSMASNFTKMELCMH